MDIENFIAEFKKTFVYDMLKDYVTDEKLFDHVVEGTKVIWMKEQARQMWSIWQAAKTTPEGFVLVPKEPTPKMIDAGMDSFCFPLDNGRFYNHDLIFAYRAMINEVPE